MSHGADRWLGSSNIACWVTKLTLDGKFENPNESPKNKLS